MAFMEVKTTRFLVAIENFNLEAFFVPLTGFIRQVEAGDLKDGFLIAALPPGNPIDRTIAFTRKPDIRYVNQIVGLQDQVVEGERFIIFVQLGVLGGAADLLKFHDLLSGLEFNPNALAIAQKDGECVGQQSIL